MWEPVGPLPASVYWRRRAVAAASVATALVVLVWTVASLLPDGDGTTNRATDRAAVSAPQPVVPSSSDPAGATPGITGFVAGAGGPGSPAAVITADPTTEQLTPAETTGPVVASTPVPVPPTGPVPCTNSMIATSAEVDRPEHRVGERPVFRLVIVNTSDQPCVRDLDALRQELVVWSGDGATRLWSSNDCQNVSRIDLRTLVPDRPLVFTLRWVGRTSSPGCAEPRKTVPPGSYRLMGRLDDVISEPTPFQRLP